MKHVVVMNSLQPKQSQWVFKLLRHHRQPDTVLCLARAAYLYSDQGNPLEDTADPMEGAERVCSGYMSMLSIIR